MIVLVVSATAGVYTAATLAPERLRREVERQVAEATGAPCRVGSLRVAAGLPIELEGHDVALWDGALTVARARARVSIAAAIVGEVRLSRLELEGVVLAIRGGDADSPPRGVPDPPADADPDVPDDLLVSLHEATGAALGALVLADHLVIRGARVDVAWERPAGALAFSLEDVHARLAHHRLRGDSTLVAQTRIRAGDVHRGLVEWNGSRRDGEALRLSVAVTELDLGWLASLAATSRVTGWLSGVADFELPDRERAQIDLDLVGRELAWRTAAKRELVFGVPRVAARATATIEPGKVSVRAAHVRGGPLDAVIDATASRPLGPDSRLALDARVQDLSLDELLALLDSTPAPWVEDAVEVLAALDEGRVASFVAHASGPISDWGGRAPADPRGLPPGLELSAELEDLRVPLDRDEAIEDVSLRATWVGDRVALRDVVGRRGEFVLPRLDLDLDGVSHLLDADLDQRVADAEDALLAGLPLLISLFEPKPKSRVTPPRVDLRLSHLDHPFVLWPMRALDLGIRERDGLLVGEIRSGTWAGVPLRGMLSWRGDPMHLIADLVAGPVAGAPATPVFEAPPEPAAGGLPLEGVAWTEGSFEIGALESDVWSHRRLRGRIRAAKSRVAFDAVEADALPSGRVEGDAWLELGDAHALPYRAVFAASDLDADTLFSQAKLGRGLVAGRVEARGDLRGRYEPEQHPTAALTGDVHLVARDGHVRHDLPAVLALTLAGEGLDFRSERELVRYTTCESRLELTEGVARTDALEFEGPDLRMFGSGGLDLGRPPHAIDAEVVVFLFRPVDRLLGAMPIVGDLILGGSDNLFAAYFELEGPWDAPIATYRPLRSFHTGPLRLVTGLPSVVLRGIESLGATGAEPVVEAPLAPPPGNGATP